ncbi:hypothetical protein AKJ53_01095, partial [candidate division MSBL1 archaeon SCGC-AAA382F02]
MICLGFEGTAHTFGVGIVNSDGEVLANVSKAYEPEEGGIHPREAAQAHSKNARKVLDKGLKEAGIERIKKKRKRLGQEKERVRK